MFQIVRAPCTLQNGKFSRAVGRGKRPHSRTCSSVEHNNAVAHGQICVQPVAVGRQPAGKVHRTAAEPPKLTLPKPDGTCPQEDPVVGVAGD